MGSVRLPSHFTPTHMTAGLADYPAIDVFAPAGTIARAGSYGVVVKLSGRPITGQEKPGGAYGQSVYWRNRVTGKTRYATHLACLVVELGEKIGPNTAIGLVARSPAGSRPGSDHVHLAEHRP